MFNFWWLAGLVDELEPCLPTLSMQKIKCSFFDYVQLLMIGWAGQWTRNLSASPLQPKNKLLIFGLRSTSDDQLGWSMDLKPIWYPSPVQKKNAHFWITFDFWWSARLVDELEHHLPPLSSQKNKILIFGLCSTFDDQPGWSMDSNPICHPSPAKRNKMPIFGLRSTSDDWLGWSMESNPVHPPSPVKKMKC